MTSHTLSRKPLNPIIRTPRPLERYTLNPKPESLCKVLFSALCRRQQCSQGRLGLDACSHGLVLGLRKSQPVRTNHDILENAIMYSLISPGLVLLIDAFTRNAQLCILTESELGLNSKLKMEDLDSLKPCNWHRQAVVAFSSS